MGSVDAAERVRRAEVDDVLARHTKARRGIDRDAEDLDLLARRGGRLITPDDQEWPAVAVIAFGSAAAEANPRARPPMVLWAVRPARLDETAPPRSTRFAVAAALEPPRILAPLAMLEVVGLAECHDGRWRIVRDRTRTG